jgi:thiamine biosynthesis lipoprotein
MQNISELQFEAMGTVLNIKIWNTLDDVILEKIKFEILDFTDYFDTTYSRFIENSLVYKISRKEGLYDADNIFLEILKIYFLFNKITSGAVNPLIGNTISDLGYDEKYTLLKRESVRPTPDLENTLEILPPDRVGGQKGGQIKVNEKVMIDIGAIGKGYWADKVCDILIKNNCKKFLVDGSGDMFFYNKADDQKLEVTLDMPSTSPVPSGGQKKVELYNQAICGSGTNIRNWSTITSPNLHHVIDPKNSLPTANISNTWVKLSFNNLSATFADGFATTLFFMSPEEIKKNPEFIKLGIDFEYLILANDGTTDSNLELVV